MGKVDLIFLGIAHYFVIVMLIGVIWITVRYAVLDKPDQSQESVGTPAEEWDSKVASYYKPEASENLRASGNPDSHDPDYLNKIFHKAGRIS